MRIYPHFQNTGGFFIAVLQKTGPITNISPVETSKSSSSSITTTTDIITNSEDAIKNVIVSDNLEININEFDDNDDEDNVDVVDVGQDAEGELLALLRQGQKIQAIKLYRERTGVGLKEAKDVVEALAR